MSTTPINYTAFGANTVYTGGKPGKNPITQGSYLPIELRPKSGNDNKGYSK